MKFPSFTKTTLAALTFGVSAVHGTTIATEDFTYANGALTGNSGGSGWSAGWQTVTSQASGSVTSGQSSVGGWNYRNLNTSFVGSSVAPLYFSASFAKTGGDTAYAMWLRLGPVGATGINPNGPAIGLANNQYSLRLQQGATEVNGDFGAYTSGTTVQIVGKLEFDASGGNERLTIWVNPTGVETSAFTANITGADVGWVTPGVAEVGSFILDGGSTGAIDNVKIGTTWSDVVAVPEPSIAALFGLAAGGMLIRRRR